MAQRVRRPRFNGPTANSAFGEAFLDVIDIVAAVGFAADASQCVQLCGLTYRAGDRGATNDMLVQSLRLQCGAREARAAGREDFVLRAEDPSDDGDEGEVIEGSTQLIHAAILHIHADEHAQPDAASGGDLVRPRRVRGHAARARSASVMWRAGSRDPSRLRPLWFAARFAPLPSKRGRVHAIVRAAHAIHYARDRTVLVTAAAAAPAGAKDADAPSLPR